MVACVSPADSNTDETVNTLRYAERTRSIKNSVVRNVVVTNLTPAEAAALRRENQLLKLQLFQAQTKISSMSQISKVIPFSKHSSESSTDISSSDSCNTLKILDVAEESLTKSEINCFDMSNLDIITKLRLYCASLEEKKYQIESKAKLHAEECLMLSMRADKWQHRSEILMNTLKRHGLTDALDVIKEDQSDQLKLIESLREEVLDLKTRLNDVNVDAEVSRSVAAAILKVHGNVDAVEVLSITNHIDQNCDKPSESQILSEEISEELITMSGSIENKEAMINQMTRERDCMEAMKSHFESAIQSLQNEVEVLSNERKTLIEKVTANTASEDDPHVKRLKERSYQLELKIKELQSKSEEHSKTLRMHSQAQKTIEKLEAEIKQDKKRRADLQKQLKELSVERRSEQQQAKNTAAKLIRDSQRLKMELSKVKDAASKQEAMLRRKAAEALAKQKLLEDRNNKRGRASGVKCSDFSSERRDQIQGWVEREINNALLVQDLRYQIEDNTKIFEEVEEKRQMLITQKGEENVIRALDSEIELRKTILDQLERNVNEIYKFGDRNFTGTEKCSSSFMETSFFKALSLSEMRYAIQNFFNRSVTLQTEYDRTTQEQKLTVEKAVSTALNELKRSSQKEFTALKLKHSEDIAALLESTTCAIQKKLDMSIKSFNCSDEAKASLFGILDDYVSSCSSIGSQIKIELDDIKSSQESMRKFVSVVADEMISINEAKATLKLGKKTNKTKTPIPEPDEYSEIDDEVDVGVEDTEDSDWSPDTPMPTKKKRKLINETMNTPLKTEDDKQESANEDFEKMTVLELKELLRKSGLTVGGKKSELIHRLRLNTRAKEIIALSARKKRPISSDDTQTVFKKVKLECATSESSDPSPTIPQSVSRSLTTATKASLLRRKSPPLSLDSVTPRNSVAPSNNGPGRPASFATFLTSSKTTLNNAVHSSKRSTTKFLVDAATEPLSRKRRSNDSLESTCSESRSSVNSSTSNALKVTRSIVHKESNDLVEKNPVRSARAERIRAATKTLNDIREKTKVCGDDPSLSKTNPPLSVITNSAKKRKISRREDMKRSVNQALEALEALENLGASNF